jgi:hypothetical protein
MSPSLRKAQKRPGKKPPSLVPDDQGPLKGLFVHRMGENVDDEQAVAEFWRAHGLEADALESPSQRFSRLPDLRLAQGGIPWAYCEVKTLWRHSWTVRILHQDLPVKERRQATRRQIDERIENDLAMAGQQLNAGNPSHVLLNFVVFVNRDPEASPSLLEKILAQPAVSSGRSLKARRALKMAQEVQAFRRNVDLCFWAKPTRQGKLVIEKCLMFNPSLRSFTEEITGLRGKKLVPLEPAA